jgi:hypothetical protein
LKRYTAVVKKSLLQIYTLFSYEKIIPNLALIFNWYYALWTTTEPNTKRLCVSFHQIYGITVKQSGDFILEVVGESTIFSSLKSLAPQNNLADKKLL